MRKIEILIMSISGMVEFIKIFIKIHWHVTGKRGKNVTRFMISNTDHFNVAKFELYYSLTIKNFHFAPLLKKKEKRNGYPKCPHKICKCILIFEINAISNNKSIKCSSTLVSGKMSLCCKAIHTKWRLSTNFNIACNMVM